MSLQEHNLVSRKTAQGLQALLGQTPDPVFAQRPSRGGARGRMPVIVKALDDSPLGGGGIGNEVYDAVMIGAHGTEVSADQPEQSSVWLTVWGDGLAVETPTEDGIYHGIFAGDYDPDPGGVGTDRRPRVFAAAAAAAATPTQWKTPPARVVSTTNVNISSPGATINGVTMAANDRALLPNQTSSPENGLWVWNGASVAMTRATDADSSSELVNAVVAVSEGTVNADTVWMCTNNSPITVGTTGLTWVRIYPAGITATTVDGTPNYTAAHTLQFDETDGFTISEPSAGTVRVDLLPASGTQNGVVTTGTQGFAGDKSFAGITYFTQTIIVNESSVVGGFQVHFYDLFGESFQVWSHTTTYTNHASRKITLFDGLADTQPGTLILNGHLDMDGAGKTVIKPCRLNDTDAPNHSLYYSNNSGKLVFKDGGGTVNDLY